MTNESGQPENASYAQAKHAYERRNVLDQLRERQDRLKQGAEIRAALEKACSATVLELLSGRNAADLADLGEAAARQYTSLKSAFTPERETALRDLESGKGSTLATARIFRAAPHLLDVLADTPRVRKVWELVQMLNAPEEWNGYLDAYWTTGQTVLWIVTGDPWVVDQASNDSGRLGELWGQLKAAELIDNLNLPPEHVQDAADRLRRLCLDGTMTAIDGRNRPIPAIEWRHLKIVLGDGNVLAIQHVGQSTIMPAYSHVVFSRVEVLREFKPAETSDAPMIAVGEAINGGVNIYAGGITQADADYDERTGEVLRSLTTDFQGIQYGAHQEEQGGDHGVQDADRVPGRKRLAAKPIDKRTGRATTVTAAWDVIGLHDEWSTEGIPPNWSEQKAGKEVNKHLRKLIKQGQIDLNDYPLNANSNGQYEISADSVGRALVPRRSRGT